MWAILTKWRKTYEPLGMRFTVPWFALMLFVIACAIFFVAERLTGPW